jgi:hypothetical protein
VRIVLATRSFEGPWGTETYLLTVAEALEKLGHEATIVAGRLGEMAGLARSRGVTVMGSMEKIEGCDAALVQDAVVAYEAAERFPGVPLLFVAHSADMLVQAPPQLAGICELAVAMSDRVASHLRGLANPPEVVRLHQPIDLVRFRPLGPKLPESPARALAFGKNIVSGRERLLASACERAGFELRVVGDAVGRQTTLAPERELGPATVVIGTGRCAVEGMAAGKAVYIYGLGGGDGWITSESYPAIEADGFAGAATDLDLDGDRLAHDLQRYSEEMGHTNRDLAHAHHDSLVHARELVDALRRCGASSPPPAPAQELARMVRLQRQTEEMVSVFASETLFWRRQHDGLRGSRRYRIGAALFWPLDALRRLRERLAKRRNGTPNAPRELPTAEEWLRAHSPERLDSASDGTPRSSAASPRRAGSPPR